MLEYSTSSNGRKNSLTRNRGKSDSDRFDLIGWSVQENECWIWNGYKNPSGYGKFRNSNGQMAHKFSLERALGRPLKAGMVTMHSCDNRPCVNPKHLSEGTQAKNMAEAAERTGFPQAKLTIEDILMIRSRPEVNLSALARELGVTRNAVRAVRQGKNWKWIPENKEE